MNSLFQLISLCKQTLKPRQELEQLLPTRKPLGQGKPSPESRLGTPSGAEFLQEFLARKAQLQGRAGMCSQAPTQPLVPGIISEDLREAPLWWEQPL